MVEENGSVRGSECVARICSPVRMCHPMSASARGRLDKGPASNDQKRKMKMMSRTEGRRKRRANGLGCAGVIKVCRASMKKECTRVQSFRVSKFQGATRALEVLKP